MEKQVVTLNLNEFTARDPGKREEKKQDNNAIVKQAASTGRVSSRQWEWARRQSGRLDQFWKKAGPDEAMDVKKTFSLVMKFVAAAAICLAVFLLTLSGSPTAKKITEGLNNAINYTVDIDETLGKLKLVDAGDTAAQTSAETWNMQMPILATIKSSFDETGEGVLLKGAKDSLVSAAAAGYVFAVGKDDKLGNYVKVRHSDTVETVYYGLDEVEVEENAVVDKGTELGTTNAGTLQFEVHVNGEPVDPMDYLNVA